MIEGAERRGTLRPGQCVVEYTGGSTGSSLALVCAVKGYPLKIVSSDAFATEKLQTMAAFGADVELIMSPDGITPDLVPAMRRRAAEIVEQEGAFATDQFNNRDALDGYRVIGDEILRQLLDRSARCASTSVSAGASSASRRCSTTPGRPRAHRRRAVRVRRPVGRSPGTTGSRAAAWGSSAHMTTAELDGVEAVSTAGAFTMARRAAAGGRVDRTVGRRQPRRRLRSPNASAPTAAW
jgi:cysteine synthase A